MSGSLYTQKEWAQWRGPTTSDNYNERIENLYKDLVYLYNKIGLTHEDINWAFMRLVKDHFSLMKTLEDLVSRVAVLEADTNTLTFSTEDQFDTDRFATTGYAVATNDQCYHDWQHGVVVLPKITTSSISKVRLVNSNGESVIPATFEALASGTNTTADNTLATLDTSDPYYAVVPSAGKIWQRNVIVDTPDSDGAEVKLYVRFPTDYAIQEDTNAIILHPFPLMGCDIIDVSYSTKMDIKLNETDNYHTLNEAQNYEANTRAIGWSPPGGWTGDEILNSGAKIFYFEPRAITGIRITLRQRHYVAEGLKYIYSYGLSTLDARLDKFRDSGKFMVRFDAPDGDTISDVDSVTPEIWNVPEAELTNVFSYRVIWETSYDSGVYTETAQALSSRVWIEVTLNKSLDNITPALSGLNITYS